MSRANAKLLRQSTRLLPLAAALVAAPAWADSTVCAFPRNAWQSAVASGDAGAIAAARQRVVAVRANCPDLYRQVMAAKPPARDKPDEPRQPVPVVRKPEPPARPANPIGTHFRLVTRLAKDVPLPQVFDASRGYFIGLEGGRLAKFGISSGTRIVPPGTPQPAASAPQFTQIGAYNPANAAFYAIGKAGDLAWCNAATLGCVAARGTAGVTISSIRASTNPAYDALALGTDAKGQAAVLTLRGGAQVARLALAPFKDWATSADGQYFCAIPTRPQAPYSLACADLVKRRFTGQANIGSYDPNPVTDKTRWDEGDASRQSAFSAAGNRFATYADGQVQVIDPAVPGKPQLFKLAEAGIATAGKKFAVRFIDLGLRLAVWDLREQFDSEGFTFAVIDLSPKAPAPRIRKFDLKFAARKSGTSASPLAINAMYLGNDQFLFEAPFVAPSAFSLRDGRMVPFPTPEDERADAYYGSFIAPEEGLLFAKYSAIGDYDAFDVKGGIHGLGRPGSINVWRLPGPGGYYFFHSLVGGPNEWQSEIRQYIVPGAPSGLAPAR